MSFPSDGPSSALTLSARSRGFLSDRQLHPKTARRVIRRKCPRLPEDIYSGWASSKRKATALRVPGGHFEGLGQKTQDDTEGREGRHVHFSSSGGASFWKRA